MGGFSREEVVALYRRGGGKGSHQRRGGSKLERWYRGVLVWDRKLINEG